MITVMEKSNYTYIVTQKNHLFGNKKMCNTSIISFIEKNCIIKIN